MQWICFNKGVIGRMAYMDSICKMNKEKMLIYISNKYAECYRNGEKDKTKAYLDMYERINNCEYDIEEQG
jgi:hypothetical protein